MIIGVMLNYGQNRLATIALGAQAVDTNLYLALVFSAATPMVNPAVTDNIGTNMTEVSGTSYARIAVARNTDWTIVANLATAATKTFTVGSGGWLKCNGWALCASSTPTTADALFAGAFASDAANPPYNQQGSHVAGETIAVTASITFEDVSQS